MPTRRHFLIQTAAASMVGSTWARAFAAPAKASSVVFAAQGKVSMLELDIPSPGAQEIQVRSTYSTISSGTESLMLSGRTTFSPFPCVPGYQRAGVVTAVGADVEGWKVGERVLALSGTWSNPQVARAFGAHIALANTPTEFAYHLGDGISDVDASCGVVAQVGYNAASRASFNKGDWVVIYGDGLVGQCGAQAARAKGARTILVGRRKERLEMALKCSADVVINNKQEAVLAAVRQRVGGQTVPVIIDTVQTLDAQKEYIDLLEHGRGQIVYSGYNPGVQWADMELLTGRELTTHFVSAWAPDRIKATLDLMKAGKMRISPLVTHLVPSTRAPDMYRMILDKDVPFLGITLDWR